jgi:hypothetical protein
LRLSSSFSSLFPSLASRLFVPLALLPLHMGSEELERERERERWGRRMFDLYLLCLFACLFCLVGERHTPSPTTLQSPMTPSRNSLFPRILSFFTFSPRDFLGRGGRWWQ